MSDEAFEPLVAKKPPDFSGAGSKWKPTETLSAHMYITAPRVMRDSPATEADVKMPSWVGTISCYEKDGIGVGREYDFFGKGPRLKYWGMKGDKDEDGKDKPLYHDLAILWDNGKWEIFSFADYEVETLADFGQKADAKRAGEVHVALFRKKARSKIGNELRIKR